MIKLSRHKDTETKQYRYNPNLEIPYTEGLEYYISYYDSNLRDLIVEVAVPYLEFNVYPLQYLKTLGFNIVPIIMDYLSTHLPYKVLNYNFGDDFIIFSYKSQVLMISPYLSTEQFLIYKSDNFYITMNNYNDLLYMIPYFESLLSIFLK